MKRTAYKRVLAFIVTLSLLAGLLPAVILIASAELSGTCGTNATWELSSGVLTVSGTGDIADVASATASPWYENKDDITQVVINEGITAVGKYAFTDCANLVSVSLPTSLAKIQLRSFQGCTSLTSLTIPENVVTLGQEALKNSGITDLEFLGNAPTTISTGGSGVCGGLTYTLRVPANWTDAKITALKGTPTIVRYGSCGDDAVWELADNILTISGSGAVSNYALSGGSSTAPWIAWKDSITSVVVEDGITKLGHYAFYQMTALTSVTLPSTLARIETRVFKGCSALTSITLPSAMQYLGLEALVGTSVADIYLQGVSLTSFSATAPCTGLNYNLHLRCDDSVATWEERVSQMGGTANSIVVSEHDFDGFGVCQNCGTSLSVTSVTISGASTDSYYLNDAPILTATVLPGGLPDDTVIWSSLDPTVATVLNGTLTFHSGGTATIRAAANAAPTVYDEVTVTALNLYHGSAGTSAEWVLDPANGTLTISGTGTIRDYTTTLPAPWHGYRDIITKIEIESGITKVGNYAFWELENVTQVEIADSVVNIATGAFRYCTSLASLTLVGDMTYLGARAFANGAIADLYIKGAVPTTVSGTTPFDTGDTFTLHLNCTETGNDSEWQAFITKLGGVGTLNYDIHADGYSAATCPLCNGSAPISSDAVTQMLEIAQTYVDHAADLVYGNFNTPFNEETTNEIDCSSFVMLVLYGISYENSRFVAGKNNLSDYNFGVNLASNTAGDYGYERYLANELAQYGSANFYTVYDRDSTDKTDLTAIRPGDVLFFDNVENTAFYRSITHTAICVTTPVSGSMQVVHGNNWSTVGFGTINVTGTDSYWKDTLVTAIRFPIEKSGAGDTPVSSMNLSEISKTVNFGDTLTITATVLPTDAKNTRLVWQSSDPTVASVLGGKITAKKAGTATITATAADGSGVSASCNLTVTATASGTCGTNATYAFADGVLTISGTGATEVYTYSSATDTTTAPWDAWRDFVQTIVVEEGITQLGHYAFYGMSNVTSVTLPSTLQRIETAIFKNCSSLTAITLPAGVTFVGHTAFVGSGLTDMTANSDVLVGSGTHFGGQSAGNHPMEDLTYTIHLSCGADIGLWNAALTKLGGTPTLQQAAHTYVSGTCSVCGSVTSASGDLAPTVQYSYADNVLTVSGNGEMPDFGSESEQPWYSYRSQITKIVIGNGITAIGKYAFTNCVGVTDIELPSTLQKIQLRALYQCTALSALTLPASVTVLGQEALCNSGISSLTALGDAPKTISTSGSKVLGATACTVYAYCNRNWSQTVCEKLGDHVTYVKVHAGTEDSNGHCGACRPNNGAAQVMAEKTAPETAGEQIEWHVENGTLTITGTGAIANFDRVGPYVAYPWAAQKDEITSVVIGEGITTLGNYCLYGLQNVTSVTLPSTLTRIETCSLAMCSNLRSLTIPSTMAFIGYNAFIGTRISDLFFGAGAPVNASTTKPCTGLTYKVHIVCNDRSWNTAKLDMLGGNATFVVEHLDDYNATLKSCSRCDGITATSSHGECGKNVTWKLSDGILVIFGSGKMTDYIRISGETTNVPWTGYEDQVKKVVIEDGVTSVGSYAFYNMVNLSDVTLPKTLTRIETRPFAKCAALTSLTIPATLDFLGYEAFVGSGLKEVRVEGAAPTAVSSAKPFDGLTYKLTAVCGNRTWTEEKLASLGGTVSLTIEHLTDYNAEAESCSRCRHLNVKQDSGTCGKSAKWSFNNDTLTITGTGATENYSRISGTNTDAPWADYSDRITKVVVSEGITSLGNYAFYDMENLESVTLPSSLTRIESRVFANCKSLKSVKVPGKLAFLGYEAFVGSGLEKLDLGSQAPDSISETAPCKGLTYSLVIPCHESTWTEAKLAALGGTPTVTERHVVVNGVCIRDEAAKDGAVIGSCGDTAVWAYKEGTLTISGFGAMTQFTRNANTDAINRPWNKYKDEIVKAVVEPGITSIGNYTFYKTNKLASVTIPSTVTELGYGAFLGTKSLQAITIPASVRKLGSSVFQDSGLQQIRFLGDLPTSYGKNLFDGVIATAYHNCSSAKKSYGKGLTWQEVHHFEEIDGVKKCRDCGTLAGTPVISVSLDREEAILFVDGSLTLTATVLPDDAENKTLQWSSSDEAVATVTPDGVVTAHDFGSTVITAKSTDGSPAWATCKVTVRKGVGGFVDDLTWIFNDGELTFIGEGVTVEAVDAPWAIYRDQVTRIVLEDGIYGIGDQAFAAYTQLSEVTLPRSLTVIGKEAFLNDSMLQSVSFPANLTEIGAKAFASSGLQTIQFNGAIPANCAADAFESVKATVYVPCDSDDNGRLGEQLTVVKMHDYQEKDGVNVCAICGDIQANEQASTVNTLVIIAVAIGVLAAAGGLVAIIRKPTVKGKREKKKEQIGSM